MPTGLQRRGARYYIRRRVPVDLVPHLGVEVTRALGTANPKEARRRLAIAWVGYDDEFDRMRAQLGIAEPQQETALKDPPLEEISPTLIALVHLDRLREDRDRAAKNGALAEYVRDKRAALRLIQAMLDGEVDSSGRDFRELEGLRNGLLAHLNGENAFAVSAARKTRAALEAEREAAAVKRETPLDLIVDKWAAEGTKTQKTIDAHRAVARWFVERVGATPVEQLTLRDVLAFKDKLLEEGTSLANVKVKLTRLRTLLSYATKNAYLASNPALGVHVVDNNRDRNRRRPFDRTALAAVFGSPVYVNGERPSQGRGEAAYWLPLLALLTGARLEELGQLRPRDVRLETYLDLEGGEAEAWVIQITEDAEDGLKLKNAGSERLVPIHPDLHQLGFIEFAQAALRAEQPRLFPALRPDRYGRLTAKWGEWFSRYKRNVCGVTDTRIVFHSFRHTFKDCATNIGMPEGVQRKLMGHSRGKDAAQGYGEGYSFHHCVEWMKRYRVPGFQLPPPLIAVQPSERVAAK